MEETIQKAIQKYRQKGLHFLGFSVSIKNCDILNSLLLLLKNGGQRPQGGKKTMNKYELAVVLSAKLEDDERTAALEKVKGYITRFGGTVTDVDEWGK